jgi:hypothetical protein
MIIRNLWTHWLNFAHVPCKVNLIEYPIDDGEFQQASEEANPMPI